ncbi:unnamed protein product [Parnassius apollo]|uniref:(apollo) hypothetical protein n=1 Tax=Parnassius apollo TaxID=110799 RepID=A0A8S3XY24_PARAO|nr:unnamed protein product [Parnassius apollo]
MPCVDGVRECTMHCNAQKEISIYMINLPSEAMANQIQVTVNTKRDRELAAAGKKNDCDSPANTANGVCVCEMLPFTEKLQCEYALFDSV